MAICGFGMDRQRAQRLLQDQPEVYLPAVQLIAVAQQASCQYSQAAATCLLMSACSNSVMHYANTRCSYLACLVTLLELSMRFCAH